MPPSCEIEQNAVATSWAQYQTAFGYAVTGGFAVAAYGPPPTVWWSTPDGPPPCAGTQLSPPSSLMSMRLVAPASWLTMTRPFSLSPQMIGSRVVYFVVMPGRGVHRAVRCTSSNETEYGVVLAITIELPVFQLAAMVGSTLSSNAMPLVRGAS